MQPVLLRVHVLEVVEKEVDVGQRTLDGAPGGLARGVHRRVQPLLLAAAQQGGGKVRLHEGLSAREGHASSRGLVEAAILQHLCERLLHRPAAAGRSAALRRSRPPRSCPLERAEGPVEAVIAGGVHAVRPVRAGSDAGAAADAAPGMDQQLRAGVDRLGVVTPGAGQAAPLEKDRGPYARPVVDCEALEVEDQPRRRRGRRSLRAHGSPSRCTGSAPWWPAR